MACLDASELVDCLRPLRRFAWTLTRNDDRAADLVQDCVERCLRKQHLFDGSNLRSWMFTVCRNIFVNQVRRERSQGTAVPVDDVGSMVLAVPAPQEPALEFSDLLNGMAALSTADQDLVWMVALEGAKYDEAADRLGIPIGTVRSRLSRARARIKAYLTA